MKTKSWTAIVAPWGPEFLIAVADGDRGRLPTALEAKRVCDILNEHWSQEDDEETKPVDTGDVETGKEQ